jgi:hypothetical protein
MLTAGHVLSRVKLNVPVLVSPAKSVCVALNVCAPSMTPLGRRLQFPAALAVAVPSVVAPSLMVTTVLASPVPMTPGFEVILSVAELPVSEANAILTAGAVLSSVKLSVAVVVTPAASVSDALSVCAPLARAPGVKLQIPVPLAVVVPSVTPPSLMVTTAFT